MRLAIITNWAYGATVALTLASGASMIVASAAQDHERAAVEQRYLLNRATARLDSDIFALSDHARQFLNTGDPAYAILYKRDAAALGSVEARIGHLGDAGAREDELDALAAAVRRTDTLHDEQRAALTAFERGQAARARDILFGNAYERELDRARSAIEKFQYLLNERTEAQVASAAQAARIWKTVSEAALGITGLLFICVLFFVFTQRVLKPVVRLSDVVNRLAAQDYAVEPPNLSQIDEIGDMAQAIAVFRENGLARQRLELEREADRAHRDLLSRMTQRMQACDCLRDLQDIVRRFAPLAAPDLAGRLYLIDPPRNALVQACEWLDPVDSREEFPPTACWALRRGLPHRPAGSMPDAPCPHLDAADEVLRDPICLPLTAQGEVLGLLYFETRDSLEPRMRTSTTYLTMLAENIGLALANLRLRDQLREMAMADPLTGLANRRQLETVMANQSRLPARNGEGVSCVMVDVDHFKRFNDEFGHDAGDAVLRRVGAILRDSLREDDFACRFGGEEFLLLLPGSTAADAAARAEQLRTRVAELAMTHEGAPLGPVQASFGVATAPAHCTVDRLVQTADAALLRAKDSGRNRVVVAAARREKTAA